MLSSIQNVVSSLPDGWNKQGEKSLLSNNSEKNYSEAYSETCPTCRSILENS